MKIKNIEKAQKIKEIQEKFKQLEVDSLDNKAFFDKLIQEGVLSISPQIEKEIQDENFEFITLDKNILMGGVSKKPGNIIFDVEKCISTIIPKIYATIGILKQDSILIKIIGILGIISLLNVEIKIKISIEQASVLMSIWKNHNEDKKVDINSCYKETNNLRLQYEMTTLGMPEYERVIDELCKIKCIKQENGMIFMQEYIKINY